MIERGHLLASAIIGERRHSPVPVQVAAARQWQHVRATEPMTYVLAQRAKRFWQWTAISASPGASEQLPKGSAHCRLPALSDRPVFLSTSLVSETRGALPRFAWRTSDLERQIRISIINIKAKFRFGETENGLRVPHRQQRAFRRRRTFRLFRFSWPL
jgi:hypothetical protein